MTGPWSRWHNVESLDPVNLSVNYWWVDGPLAGGEPFAALAHSLLAIKPLPADRREVWRQMFDHYEILRLLRGTRS
jgi:hypothetical protein